MIKIEALFSKFDAVVHVVANVVILILAGMLIVNLALYLFYDILYKSYERTGRYRHFFHDLCHMHVHNNERYFNKFNEPISKCKYCDEILIYDTREGWRVANEKERE